MKAINAEFKLNIRVPAADGDRRPFAVESACTFNQGGESTTLSAGDRIELGRAILDAMNLSDVAGLLPKRCKNAPQDKAD